MSIPQKPQMSRNARAAGPDPTAPAPLVDLAALAGVAFNGPNPWDIQVHDARLYQRILTRGSLGFGEAYMDGMWSCHAMDELFTRFLKANIDARLRSWHRLRLLGEALRQMLFNLQSPQRAYQVGKQHYDIGNDLFTAMLDPGMNYSCGYWKDAQDLEQAQIDKLDLICRKLELKPGEHVLEIGCGWGGLAYHAATHYGARVTGVTVSREQKKLAEERCTGLPVEIKLVDYRGLEGQYDKIVSVGMFEHVGRKNYPDYFRTVERVMRDDGLFLLHTIGNHRTVLSVDAWIDKYIFPNGKLPSARELGDVLEGKLIIEDWHNFGPDYDRTLMAWWHNFDRAWPDLAKQYGDRFYRMWRYYLMSCAGFFRSRQGQLWQLVLSKRGRESVYRSLR